jgi:sugar phosphate isomerase/epimerase
MASGQSAFDLPKVKQTLDDMGWSGWLVIERSRDAKDSRNEEEFRGKCRLP